MRAADAVQAPPMRRWLKVLLVLLLLGVGAWWYAERWPIYRVQGADPGPASARTVVSAHLRALEAGDWDRAAAVIAADYRAIGAIPFPISLFVRLGQDAALTMHIARRRAMPDFRFNETYLVDEPNHVRIQVELSGTHTGVIDYTGILNGVPVVEPTGKAVKLPREFFDYYVRDGKIVLVVIEIPADAGVPALLRAVQ